MRIGLIGAGLMGEGVGASLLRHGHALIVKAHRNRAPIETLKTQGAVDAGTLAEIAANAEVIIICVSTAQIVEATVAGLKPHLKPGQIIIDCGTTRPETTRQLAAELAQHGILYADAPLTGGPAEAQRGELGALVGADDQTYARIEPVLQCFATTVRRFGPPGAGHTAKLISNYLVTGMVALVSDVFSAAKAENISAAALYDVMLNGSGNSGVLRKMVGPALTGDFDGYRFGLANAAKDIGYYAALARAGGRSNELVEAVAKVFARALETGDGGRTVSHLLEPALGDR